MLSLTSFVWSVVINQVFVLYITVVAWAELETEGLFCVVTFGARTQLPSQGTAGQQFSFCDWQYLPLAIIDLKQSWNFE